MLLVEMIQADVLVDIECDAKHLDKVIHMLQREVQSVNYASTQITGEYPPPTPLSACSSFGITDLISLKGNNFF